MVAFRHHNKLQLSWDEKDIVEFISHPGILHYILFEKGGERYMSKLGNKPYLSTLSA